MSAHLNLTDDEAMLVLASIGRKIGEEKLRADRLGLRADYEALRKIARSLVKMICADEDLGIEQVQARERDMRNAAFQLEHAADVLGRKRNNDLARRCRESARTLRALTTKKENDR